VEVVEHRHLQAEIANGNRIVLGLYEVDPDHAGIGGRCFEASESLREDRLWLGRA
jgi:hypothetical protein